MTIFFLPMLFVQVETEFVSVERVLEYANLAAEDVPVVGTSNEPASKDDSGDLIISNVSLRYSETLPWVLRSLSVRIPQGSKVAGMFAVIAPPGTSVLDLWAQCVVHALKGLASRVSPSCPR